MRGPRDDVGVATVFGLALLGVLTAAALTGVGMGALVVAHRHAQAAADLSALAAASALQRGEAPCAVAAVIAARNGAQLSQCRVLDGEVLVRARREALRSLGVPLAATGAARAGPVTPGVGGVGPTTP